MLFLSRNALSASQLHLANTQGSLAGSYVRSGLRELRPRARSAFASITSFRTAKFSPVRGHKPTYATAHLRFTFIPPLLHYLRSAAPEENFLLPRAVPFESRISSRIRGRALDGAFNLNAPSIYTPGLLDE